MVMGIELVSDRKRKNPIKSKQSINKIVFEEGRKHNVYFRTLGNILMLVPPLAISMNELNLLIDGALKTIKGISSDLK
jgi:adenosylmethionine-8-amino-7-oxononanoate aminotransferase